MAAVCTRCGPRYASLTDWPVADSGNWYDFVVTCEASPSFARRFAGRMETGEDTVSDPEMGGV